MFRRLYPEMVSPHRTENGSPTHVISDAFVSTIKETESLGANPGPDPFSLRVIWNDLRTTEDFRQAGKDKPQATLFLTRGGGFTR